MKKLLLSLGLLTAIVGVGLSYDTSRAVYGLTESANQNAGTNSHLSRTVDDASLDLTGASTVEVWIYYDGTIAAGTKDIFYKQENGGAFNGWRWYLSSASNALNFGSESTTVTVSWTPSIDTWYHLAATNDGAGNVKFYVNGAQQGATQTGFSNPTAGTQNFELGSTDDDTIVTANYSLARIWNTERSQAQIDADKCNVLGATANLAAEWTLNDTLLDNSGNGLTLTNNNSVTFDGRIPAVCATAAASAPDDGLVLFQ